MFFLNSKSLSTATWLIHASPLFHLGFARVAVWLICSRNKINKQNSNENKNKNKIIYYVVKFESAAPSLEDVIPCAPCSKFLVAYS